MISYNIITKQKALLTISGRFSVKIPLIIQQKFPTLTRYLTMSAFFINIPLPLKTVAIQPIISAIIIKNNPGVLIPRVKNYSSFFLDFFFSLNSFTSSSCFSLVMVAGFSGAVSFFSLSLFIRSTASATE